ncbi:hypothetical protein pb186bvf_020832 [Paramecium bursaria]
MLGDDSLQAYELIRQQLNQKKQEIMNFLKPQKKNSNPIISVQDNNSRLHQFKPPLLMNKQILLQQIYETTAEFNFVNLDVVWNTWPATGNKDNNSKQLSQEVVECLDHLLEYAQQKGYSNLDMSSSGYIERAELKIFLSKCNIILEEMQLMQVFDHFDQEGDGSISKILRIKKQGLHKKQPRYINKVDLFQIFVSIDADGQGSISKDQFKQMLRSKIIIPLDQEEYKDFFKMIDSKEDGPNSFL